MANNYYVSGYTPPKGVDDREKVKSIQRLLGVAVDGVWGAKTQAAFERAYQTAPMASAPAAATGKYSGAEYMASGGTARTASSAYDTPLKISSAPVKNAAYAVPSEDRDAIAQMQNALAYYVPSLSVNGVYDAATAKAFEQYGNRALYSTKRMDANGNPYTVYGVVQSGNAASPWQTEEQRRNANNAHLARYGVSGEAARPLYDTNGNKLDYGSLGHDGMGGVYDPEGYSSNPYFLMANAGVSRDQLTGVAAQASDKAIKMALEVDPAYLGRDLYVTNGGGISSAYTPDSISVNAIRAEIAGLRGLASTKQVGMGQVAVEIPKPDYYTPVSSGNTSSVTAQDAYSELYSSLASRVGNTGGGQDLLSYYYDMILQKLGGTAGGYSLPTYSAEDLYAQYASYLRPSVDSAIAYREEAAKTNRAELDADAAARGMGSSTFVSSLKSREEDAAAADIAGLESSYLATLSERVQEGMMAQLERQQEWYLQVAEQQAAAQKTALSLASDWYFDYMDRMEKENSSQKTSGKKSGSSYKGDVLSYGEYAEFVSLLNNEERKKLRSSSDKTWSAYREEMVYALGEEGFNLLLNNAG